MVASVLPKNDLYRRGPLPFVMGSNITNPSGLALERGMWAAVAVATFILILRIIAKIKIRNFRIDDVLMIIAWVTNRPSLSPH